MSESQPSQLSLDHNIYRIDSGESLGSTTPLLGNVSTEKTVALDVMDRLPHTPSVDSFATWNFISAKTSFAGQDTKSLSERCDVSFFETTLHSTLFPATGIFDKDHVLYQLQLERARGFQVWPTSQRENAEGRMQGISIS